jgi:hypothetical protein
MQSNYHLIPIIIIIIIIIIVVVVVVIVVVVLLAFTTHLRVLASSFFRFQDHTQ